jgi:hypothetical protein
MTLTNAGWRNSPSQTEPSPIVGKRISATLGLFAKTYPRFPVSFAVKKHQPFPFANLVGCSPIKTAITAAASAYAGRRVVSAAYPVSRILFIAEISLNPILFHPISSGFISAIFGPCLAARNGGAMDSSSSFVRA